MIKRIAVFALLHVCIASIALAGDGRIRRVQKRIPGSYIIMLERDIIDEVSYIVSDLVKKHRVELVHLYDHVLKGASVRATESQAEAIGRDSRVSAVWEDEEGQISGSIAARSWNVDRMDERIVPRLDGNYSFCQTGKGVYAYVVDTGIWAGHDEFANADPVTGGPRVRLGYDLQAGFGVPNLSNDPNCGRDDTSPGLHGTKVASVLGGRTLGVAPEVTMVPVRVMTCTANPSLSATVDGLRWIVTDPNYTQRPNPTQPAGRVVNLSINFGVSSTSPGTHPVEVALRDLEGMGITVVIGAGNSNADALAAGHVPARDDAHIVAGGSQGRNVGDADARWFDPSTNRGSNFGPTIDLFAPARNVMVALWSSSTAVSVPSDDVQSTGTSFAAPLVAGAAARYLEFYPTESHAQMQSRLVNGATSGIDGLDLLDRRNSPNRLLYMSYGCKQQAVSH